MNRSAAGRPHTAGGMPPSGLRLPLGALRLGWPLARVRALLGAAGSGLRFVSRRRRLRIAIVAALLTLAVLAGGWLLLRHSSFVAVRHVQVSGVHGPEAKAIDAALLAAGRRMSTLDVRAGALRAAVAPFRVVREVHASASFPHGLHISVVEQLPVAALTVGSVRTAVAADGDVLGPALLSGSLPTVNGTLVPAAGARVSSAAVLAPLIVLGAAPGALAKVVARVFSGPKGLTVAMANGLEVYFGDDSLPHAKWLSLARVLADPTSAGASYIDVRLPGRPAAGFAPGTTPPGASGASGTSAESSASEQSSSSESTLQALAAGLARSSPAAGTAAGEAASSAPSGASSTPSTSTEPSPESPSSPSGEGSESGHEERSEASREAGH